MKARGAIESQLRAQEMGGSLDVVNKYRWIAGRFNQFVANGLTSTLIQLSR